MESMPLLPPLPRIHGRTMDSIALAAFAAVQCNFSCERATLDQLPITTKTDFNFDYPINFPAVNRQE